MYVCTQIAVSTGIITTIAGYGFTTDPGNGEDATSAALYSPSGVAVDVSGHVYIADTSNQRIRVVCAATIGL